VLPGPIKIIEDREQHSQYLGDPVVAGVRLIAGNPLAVVGILGRDPLQVADPLVDLGAQGTDLGR
jgi:hypothetical protein